MEVQPQLLLLQKTILIAEGTGRRLAPEANMWFLARPLIEEWMARTLGPQAQLRDGVTEVTSAVARLPRFLDRVEKGAATLADGRIRLHPETIQALRGDGGGRSFPLSLWAVVLLFVFALLIVL